MVILCQSSRGDGGVICDKGSLYVLVIFEEPAIGRRWEPKEPKTMAYQAHMREKTQIFYL
jgi:hypothetical protein